MRKTKGPEGGEGNQGVREGRRMRKGNQGVREREGGKKKEGGGGKVEGGRLGSLTILPCPWSQWPTETTNLKREEGRPEPDQLPLQLKINDQLGVPKPIIDTRVI